MGYESESWSERNSIGLEEKLRATVDQTAYWDTPCLNPSLLTGRFRHRFRKTFLRLNARHVRIRVLLSAYLHVNICKSAIHVKSGFVEVSEANTRGEGARRFTRFSFMPAFYRERDLLDLHGLGGSRSLRLERRTLAFCRCCARRRNCADRLTTAT